MDKLKIDDPDFDAKVDAMRAENKRLPYRIRFVKAWYEPERNMVMATLSNHMLIGLPADLGQEISQFSSKQLSGVKIGPGGTSLYWPQEGAGIEITSLLAGRFGSRKWMEKLNKEKAIPLGTWFDSQEARSELARVAGSSSTPAKAQAARENGMKGGRPRKQELADQNPRPRFGSARGLIHMSDDFDEPLDDFVEYTCKK